MFKLLYFWLFVAAFFLNVCLRRTVVLYRHDAKSIFSKLYSQLLLLLGTVALIVFVVLGFWFMPHWWYAPLFLLFGIISTFIPISDEVGAYLALVIEPMFIVLMYLSLFNVI